MPMKPPEPSKPEAMALFRLGIVGDLLAADLPAGDLQAELRARSETRYRPPGAPASRRYHWKTLQSWYYAAKHGGLDALRPASRQQGYALALPADRRELLLQIRREHPTAPADLILETAIAQGVVDRDQVSVSTLRRLFQAHDLPRSVANRADRRARQRWEAASVGALWHADVCHIWRADLSGDRRKVYVHGLLDDHSRFGLTLEGRDAERETDLLSVLFGALLRYPPPAALYVDNGACYRGEVLAKVCDRLGIKLIHAKPYDPQARGKMERFWRTMRQRCTDHLPIGATLQDVNSALLAYLDADYHVRPHASLMAETPFKRFQVGLRALPAPWSAADLAAALEITDTRRVAGDATFSVEGRLYEVRGLHLRHRMIEVVLDPFTDAPLRASYQGQPVVFGPCDPAANRHRRRPAPVEAPAPTVPFDPVAALLARARKETK